MPSTFDRSSGVFFLKCERIPPGLGLAELLMTAGETGPGLLSKEARS